jgi:hypothetical protein
MNQRRFAALVAAGIFAIPSLASAGGFRGSKSSMQEQHAVAVKRDLAFISDAAEVRALVEEGGLEAVVPTADFTLADVSFPYALPEVKVFIERLGKQYREANGAPLVVTSLTRPASSQPRNAHKLSVHPAGMAVDLRIPQDNKAKAWLESVLLQLENRGVLDVTRERFPPHYHVAVYPAAYSAYVEKLKASEPPEPAPEPVVPAPEVAEPAPVVAASVVPATADRSLSLVLLISLSATVLIALAARRYAFN